MPRIPQVTYRQAEKALVRLGFTPPDKRSGSHRVFHHPATKRTATLPDHGIGTIAKGTLKNALRQARVSVEEFLRALRS
jgi:predicted RNA binding protein YcfA (HicA-like mRNA interferase family)